MWDIAITASVWLHYSAMRTLQLVKFLVPRSLRRLRWQTRTPRNNANWLMRGGEPEALLLPSLCDGRRVSIDVGGNVGGYTWLSVV